MSVSQKEDASRLFGHIDLGRWFADDYRIPGEPAVVPEKDQDDDDDEC